MAPRLVLAIALSTAPFVLEAWGGGGWFSPGLSWSALVLLPWLACSGLPAIGAGGPTVCGWLACALPTLGLAFGMDARRGDIAFAGSTLVFGLLACGVLRAGVVFASRNERARRVHALAWGLVVPGWAAVPLATRWAVAGGATETGELARARVAGPLGWAVGRLTPTGDATWLEGIVEALPALAGSVLVLVLAHRFARGSASGDEHGESSPRREGEGAA